MSSRPSTADLVARIDSEVDGIDGLITVVASGEDVLALVGSRSEVRRVREALVRLGVPPGRLVVQVVDEALIPYPVTDRRLERWMEDSHGTSTVEAPVTGKGPDLRMTPGGISKVVVGGAVALYVLSIIVFLLLMVWQRLME